jgi:Family of unknown function (DUF5317)
VAAVAPGQTQRWVLRDPWLLLAGAALEVAAEWWTSGTFGLVVVLVGYAALVAFAVRNARTVGMVLVAAGLLANLVVIAVDGGMPVKGEAPGVSLGARHHGLGPGDHLTALADVVRLSPLGATVSAGDILLGAGIVTVLGGMALGRVPRIAGRRARTA